MRRAFTLIEMVTVIGVSAALTGIAISLLLVLFRAEKNGRDHIGRAEVLRQLADQFRRDVHAADDVTVNGKDQWRWRFRLPAGRIDWYMLGDDGLCREEKVLTQDLRMERYELPRNSTAVVEVDRAKSPNVIALTIAPKDALSQPGQQFRIEAVLGRDLRFAQERKEGK